MLRLRNRATFIIMVTTGLSLIGLVYFFLGTVISDGILLERGGNQENFVREPYDDGDLTAKGWRNSRNYDKRDDPADSPLFQGHRIVHLDLKGAPFKVSYYSYLFPLLHTLGATGILIEYEDMFPYSGDLANIPATNAYTKSDVEIIQKRAKESKLEVIPLIQTFGHFEFVLKLESYKDIREVENYPQVLCPSRNKSIQVIHKMIDQIIAAHSSIRYLHIGADEVYQLGECSKCQETLISKSWDKRQLFLNHVVNVAKYVREHYPAVKVLMWDDEFREIEPQEIIDRGLNKLVEPVVWKYTPDPATTLTEQLWKNYAKVWKSVWVATAFKGATAPDSYYTDISYHIQNHQRWLEIISTYSSWINFKGVMLTGWQRYDHFSVLCELLASALPSLAVNLAVLDSTDLSDFPIEVPNKVIRKLGCEMPVNLGTPEPQHAWTKCEYLGSLVYATTLRLFILNQEVTKMEQDNTFKGWFNPYNVKYEFSSPIYVERATVELDRMKAEVMYIEKEMRVAMNPIYDIHTADEWVQTFLAPINDKLNSYWEAKEKLLGKTSWSRRPVKIEL